MIHTIRPRPQFLAECLDRALDLTSSEPACTCPGWSDGPGHEPGCLRAAHRASRSRVAAEVAADVAELVRLLRSETELTQKLDHGVSLITRALGFAPGAPDLDAVVSSISELVARRDVHLRLIATLSHATPLPDEATNWPTQRAALLAEVGTLRARVAELERGAHAAALDAARRLESGGRVVAWCPAAPPADRVVFATDRLRDAHPDARHALSPLLGCRWREALVRCTHADLADPRFREWLTDLKTKLPPATDLELEVSW